MRKLVAAAAAATALAVAGATYAAVTFDSNTGTGFVGKGDVQLVYGWNNAQLQQNAGSVQFRANSASVTEYTWTCDRDAGPQTQERARTVTTTTQGVVSHVTRVRNQITGFTLTGYSGTPTTTEETEGPALWSCPTFWTAIDMVTTGPTPLSGGDLEVSNNGVDWTPIG